MEGYAVGVSKEGELFASVTTSNYPFTYVDDKYNVCNSNTIYLKTNLNNIAVASNSIYCFNPALINPETKLAEKLGGLQGVMPSGKFEMRQLLMHGFDGQVIVAGYRDLLTEDSSLLAAFSRFLRTRFYRLPGHKAPLQEKAINTIDFDILERFLEEFPTDEQKKKVYGEFKKQFVPFQIQNMGMMKSSDAFFKEVCSL